MSEFLSSRVLHAGPYAVVGDVRCSCARCGRTGEETTRRHSIALPRKGVFVKHVGRETVTADANTAIFFQAGRGYRVSHPCDGGDDCTTIAPSEELLRDALGAVDRRAAEDPLRPFAFTHGRVSPRAFAAQSRLFCSLARGALGELEVDERVFDLLEELLHGVCAQPRGGKRSPGRSAATHAAHRDAAEGAKAALAQSAPGRVDLARIAKSVHSSPYHLSRLFREHTGSTMSAYLLRLRVRRAMTLLAEGERDITRVALGAGFCDHSHMTNAFRREFGLIPKAFRSILQSSNGVQD